MVGVRGESEHGQAKLSSFSVATWIAVAMELLLSEKNKLWHAGKTGKYILCSLGSAEMVV
jgi:hypothetical protein